MVQLVNTRIHGNLFCSGGRFDGWQNAKGPKDLAVFGDYMRITGSVQLDEGFHATGGVRVGGGMIDRSLVCEKATFESQDRPALDLENSNIGASLRFRRMQSIVGRITLTGARATTLDDDDESWQKVSPNSLDLDGFRYDRFAGEAPIDVKTRIAWLGKEKQEYLAGASNRSLGINSRTCCAAAATARRLPG
jgi:hypothetical protein